MKKRLLALFLAICMSMMLLPMTALAAAGTISGSGTESDPYLIEDLADLKAFRDNVNAGNNYAGRYVRLAANIDMSSIANWTPIGDTQVAAGNKYLPADANKVFCGVFDGNNKVLSNLKIEKYFNQGADGEANLGLFSFIHEGATVKNLTITNVDIATDGRNVGALAGVTYGSIDNITVNGNIQIKGGNNVSGVGGMNRNHAVFATNITLSGNTGSTITGNNIVGGIFAEVAPSADGNARPCTFENLSVANVAISGVGGVGGIVALLSRASASTVSVQNVELVGKTTWKENEGRIRLGSIAGLLGGDSSTISNIVAIENVTAKNLEGEDVVLPVIGANYAATSNATEAKIGDVYYATLAKALLAAAEGDTITLLADVNLAAAIDTEKSLTIEFDGNKIVCAGENDFVVPGYKCIPGSKSGTYEVVKKSDNVTVDTTVSAGESSVDVAPSMPDDVKEAFKDDNMRAAAADSAADLVAAAGSMANNDAVVGDAAIKAAIGAEDETANTTDLLKEVLKKAEVEGADEATITVHVQPYLDIALTQIETQSGTDPEIVSLTVDIKPMYDLVATTAADDAPIVTSGTDKNAVVLDTQPMTVSTPVTITIPLPAGFSVPDTNKIYIIHVKDENTQYVYEGNVTEIDGQKYVTFTNPNGFSLFTLVADHDKAARIGDEHFDTLADAIAKVEDGETIELLKDCSSEDAAVVTRNVSFTIKPNGNTYTAPVAGDDMTMTSEEVSGGKTYTFGQVAPGTNKLPLLINPAKAPAVTEPMEDQTTVACIGSTVTMEVGAENGGSYQWYVDRGNGFVAIAGANEPSYTISPVELSNDGYRYYCKVTNRHGSDVSPIFTLAVVEYLDVPKTGTTANTGLWLGMALLSLAGAAAAAAIGGRKKTEH